MKIISTALLCLFLSIAAWASNDGTYRVYILNKDASGANPYLHNPFVGQEFVLFGPNTQQWLKIQPGGYLEVNEQAIPLAALKQPGAIQLYVDVHYSQEGPQCYSLPIHHTSGLSPDHIVVWMSAQPKKSFSNDCDVYWHGAPPPSTGVFNQRAV